MRNIFDWTVKTILLSGACLILSSVNTVAATLTVDTILDNLNLSCTSAPNDCSLRAAIALAAPGDTVTFDAGLFFAPRSIKLSGGELVINKNLTIIGVGGVIIDGNGVANSVFSIFFGFTVNLSGMTVTGGRTVVGGTNSGGIFNEGTLTLTNMIVTANFSSNNHGGGISSSGTLNVINSTISDNSVSSGINMLPPFGGGGIYSSGTLNLTNSTVVGNESLNDDGGGIIMNGGTITNSAIIGNTAIFFGGGIRHGGNPLIITNSTISGNRASFGGGISGGNNGVTLRNVTITNNSASSNSGGIDTLFATGNSLVAGNTAPTNPDIGGSFTSQGNNLVQNRGTSTGYIASDLPNGTNPLLAPLANNGGLSATHALLPGSPAINAGNNALASGTTDQRGPGFARIVGAAVDIGAFETQGATAANVTIGGRILTENGRGVSNAQMWMTNTQAGVCFAPTNSFGYYRFPEVPAGETYIFDVRHKRYLFLPQILTVMEEMNDLNFTAQP